MKQLITRPAIPAAWHAHIQRLRTVARQRWTRMSEREQRLLTVAALLVFAALVFLMAIRPAWRDIVRHADELPVLRARAATVDALVQEALALRGATGARIAPSALTTEINASLLRAALGGEHTIKPVAGSTNTWEVEMTQVSAAALFDWLALTPAQLRLTLKEARIERARDGEGKLVPGKTSGMLLLTAGAP